MDYDGLACREAVVISELRAQQYKSSGSEERREHRRKVYQQRIRLIRQLEVMTAVLKARARTD